MCEHNVAEHMEKFSTPTIIGFIARLEIEVIHVCVEETKTSVKPSSPLQSTCKTHRDRSQPSDHSGRRPKPRDRDWGEHPQAGVDYAH